MSPGRGRGGPARNNAGMQVFYATQFVLPLPPGHRFPMDKYLAFRTQAQRRLEGSGLATFVGSPLAGVGDVALTHGADE